MDALYGGQFSLDLLSFPWIPFMEVTFPGSSFFSLDPLSFPWIPFIEVTFPGSPLWRVLYGRMDIPAAVPPEPPLRLLSWPVSPGISKQSGLVVYFIRHLLLIKTLLVINSLAIGMVWE